jgi:hypothetical protein
MIGNQYVGRKVEIGTALRRARGHLINAARERRLGNLGYWRAYMTLARHELAVARSRIDRAPASTRRRWHCGR